MANITQLQQTMTILLTEIADQLAKESGVIIRERKLKGSTFAQALIFGFLSKPEATYSELSQSAASVEVWISKQGLEQRLTLKAAEFFRLLLDKMVSYQFVSQSKVQPLLDRFQGVFIRDSSIIQLPKELSEVWQGVGGSQGENAALKLQVCIEYARGSLQGPYLQDGRIHDQKSPLDRLELPAGALDLADLGFFNLDVFQQQSQKDIFWITRYKAGTYLYFSDGRPLSLLTWLKAQKANQIELPVLVGAQHRIPCRLLAAKVPQEVADQRRRRLREYARKKQVALRPELLALADWTLVITNVPEEKLSLREALILLRIRWQVELLFKLWKSQGKIDEWRSQKPARILCEIYAKLIGLVIMQWILIINLWKNADRSLVKAMKVVQKFALTIALFFRNETMLTEVLDKLQKCIQADSRIEKRRKKHSAFQLLNSCLPNGNA